VEKAKTRHFLLGLSVSIVQNLLVFPAIVLLCAGSCAPQPPMPLPGRLQLSNPNFGLINVEAVITANPDCAARDDGYVSTLEFTMPNNATKFIEAPPGADSLSTPPLKVRTRSDGCERKPPGQERYSGSSEKRQTLDFPKL
jgi:hypothetical protein